MKIASQKVKDGQRTGRDYVARFAGSRLFPIQLPTAGAVGYEYTVGFRRLVDSSKTWSRLPTACAVGYEYPVGFAD